MPPPCKDIEVQLELATRVVTNQTSLEEVNGYQKSVDEFEVQSNRWWSVQTQNISDVLHF